MSDRRHGTIHDRWAELRFSVVGPLLASPPKRGELVIALEALASRHWLHPVTPPDGGAQVRRGQRAKPDQDALRGRRVHRHHQGT